MRKRLFILTTLGSLGLGFAAPALLAKDDTVSRETKRAGDAIGHLVQQIGKGGKKVGRAVSEAAQQGAENARKGGREVSKAIKGDK